MELEKNTKVAYDIPLGHLDYGYIGKCNDDKELEKIIKILRSGKEGVYPDLEKFAENRLMKINPKSKTLRKSEQMKSTRHLEKSEQDLIFDDLANWTSEINNLDNHLKNTSLDDKNSKMPNVRGAAEVIPTNKAQKSEKEKLNKRVKPRDYREWDKFDIDAELAKVDDKSGDSVTEIPKKSESKKLSSYIDTSEMSESDKQLVAQREKDKGNEAFRAADYEEALIYYNRSLSVIPCVASRNNRAQTYVKLKQWNNAIQDCNTVLDDEPSNIKALLRRAVAKQNVGDLKCALEDLQSVLVLEPNNIRAKNLKEEVENSLSERKQKGRRMVIEEVDGSSSESEEYEDAEDQAPELCNGHLVNNHDGTPSDTASTPSHIIPDEPINGDSNKTQKSPSISTRSNEEEKHSMEIDKKSEKKVLTSGDNISKKNVEEISSVKSKDEICEQEVEVKQEQISAAALALKEHAAELVKQGQYGMALDAYSSAIIIVQQNASKHKEGLSILLSNRALCKLKTGDCHGCVQDASKSLLFNAHNIKSILRRAQAYETLEKHGHAFLDYERAISFDRNVQGAHQGLSRCISMLRDTHGMKWRDMLPKKEKVAASSITSSSSSTHYQSNTTACDSNQVSQSNPSNPSVSSTTPNENEPVENYDQLRELGKGLVAKGSYSAAVEIYSKCVRLKPNLVVPYTNRALCYLKLNEPQKAREDCNEALKLEPNNSKALFRRAQAYKMLGSPSIGAKDLTALLKLEPKNVAAKKELRAMLEEVKKLLAEEEKLEKEKENEVKKLKEKEGDKKRQKIQIEEVEDSSSEDEAIQEAYKKYDSKKGEEKKKLEEQLENLAKETTQKVAARQEKCKKTPSDGAEKGRSNTYMTKKQPVQATAGDLNKRQQAPVPKSPLQATAGDLHPHKGQGDLRSPYEFLQSWIALKKSSDINQYAQLLKSVPPTNLPKVLSNKLDGDMLQKIIQCANLYLEEGDVSLCLAYLQFVTRVQRFSTVSMFMSSSDKQDLSAMLDNMAEASNCSYLAQDLEKLRKDFNL